MEPMPDLDRLLTLLHNFGVTPSVAISDSGEAEVSLVAKKGGVAGYTGFVAVFDFDADGKFDSVGVWE